MRLATLLLAAFIGTSYADGQTVIELQRSVSAKEVLKSVDWSPDGTLIAATGDIAHVRIWKAKTLSEVPGFSEMRQGMAALSQHSVTFSADGHLLAAGNLVAQVWDTATQQSVHDFVAPFVDLSRPQAIGIASLTFSPDQSLLLVGYYTPPRPPLGNPIIAYRSSDGAVVWKYEQQPVIGQPSIHTPIVTIPGRNEIAFGTGELSREAGRLARIIVLNAESGAFVRSIDRIHVDAPTTLAVSADGRWFATATSTGTNHQSLNPDSKQATVLNDQDPIRIWDVVTGQRVREIPVQAHTWALSFSRDGKYLIASQSESPGRTSLRAWRLDTGVLVQTLAGPDDVSSVFALAFSPDGHELAVAGGFGLALFKYLGKI